MDHVMHPIHRWLRIHLALAHRKRLKEPLLVFKIASRDELLDG